METFVNSTDPFHKLPDSISTLMRLISLLIIVLNAIVFSCLMLRKTRLPHVYWIQMACLSLNDTIAGLSSFFISFLDFPVFSQSIALCCGTMAFFVSSQAATLYNILIICIRRLRRVQHANSMNADITERTVALVTISVWGASFCVCLLPFLIWARKDDPYISSGCSMETAFGDKLPLAMRVLFATFLAPLLCTNIIYCVVFIVLRRMWKRTHPKINIFVSKTNIPALNQEHPNVSNTNETGRSFGSRYEDKTSSNPSTSSAVTFNINTPCVDQLTSDGKVKCHKIRLRPPLVRQNTASVKQGSLLYFTTDFRKNSAPGRFVVEQQRHKDKSNLFNPHSRSDNMTSSSTRSDKTTIIRRNVKIRKAYTLLGVILVLLNVFTWPGIVVLMMETNLSTWSLTRAVKFPLFTTVSWNAVVNPLIYTIQVKEFRTVLLDIVITYCRALRVTCIRA